MDTLILDELQRWQTAVSAVLGFTGVILALVVNAWLARRQVRDNREHERLALARALASELRFLYEAFSRVARMADSYRELKVPFYNIIQFPAVMPVMDASITRVGLLPHEQISYVTDAYFVLKDLTLKFNILSAKVSGGDYGKVKLDDLSPLLVDEINPTCPSSS
jgi:hypothetical protein